MRQILVKGGLYSRPGAAKIRNATVFEVLLFFLRQAFKNVMNFTKRIVFLISSGMDGGGYGGMNRMGGGCIAQ